MNEAQRYIRYVMPGILFGVQALVLLWIALPTWTTEKLLSVLKHIDTAVGVAIASVFVSGALGYVFATFHHWLHWHCPIYHKVLDHSGQIARLRADKLLPERPIYAPKDSRLEAFDAMTAAWLPRIAEGTPIGNAERRITRFGDLAHSAGAARVATTAAMVTTVVTCCIVAAWKPTLQSVIRYIAMVLIGVGVPLLFDEAYRHTGGMSQRIHDRILEEALRGELDNPKQPIAPI